MVARLWILLAAVQHCAAFDFDDEEDVPMKGAGGAAAPAFFDDDATGLTVELEHSFDGKTFSPRGKLFYRDSKPYTGASGGAGRASARAAQAKLSGVSMAEFQRLLTTGGYYTVRLPSVLSEPQSMPVFASVSVCSLMASKFEERLHLSLASSGRVSGISYILPVPTTQCPTAPLQRMALDEALFNTTVTVAFPEEGAKPHGKVPEHGFLPAEARAKLQRQQAANGGGPGGAGGEGGAPQDPAAGQSFLRRYSMYILPAVIMLSMGGGEPPAAEGGAAAAGGGAARPAAAAAGGKRK